jgi:hypothetical protein
MPLAKAKLFNAILCYKRFKDGRTSVEDDERSGWPSTTATPENIAKVREAILPDRRQTIHDVCEIVGLSYGAVQRILADNLNMRRISARFVPRLLSDDQKRTTTHLLAWPRPLRLFLIPQAEITAERTSFWHDWGEPRRIARGYRHSHIWKLPGMHEIMGKTLGSLYTYMRKGNTSKETVETRSYGKKLSYGQIPRIFG